MSTASSSMRSRQRDVALSVVVLVERDLDGLALWHEALAATLGSAGRAHEIVYAVSDRCRRALGELERLEAQGGALAVVVLTHWFDRVAAMQRALQHTRGEQVLVVPAGGDVAEHELTRLIGTLDLADIAVARRDVVPHRWLMRPLERLARGVFGLPLADPMCRTRACRRDALDAVGDRSVPYGLMPLLAHWQGMAVHEVEVRARPPSLHLPAALAGALGYAIATVFLYLLLSFAKRPLQLFGAVGATAFLAGLALIVPMALARLALGEAMADEPALMPGLLLIALGVQCAAIGLLAEVLIYARNRAIKDYVVERMVE